MITISPTLLQFFGINPLLVVSLYKITTKTKTKTYTHTFSEDVTKKVVWCAPQVLHKGICGSFIEESRFMGKPFNVKITLRVFPAFLFFFHHAKFKTCKTRFIDNEYIFFKHYIKNTSDL
jgi:hypothetical protein